MDSSLNIFIAPHVMDAPGCRRVQTAMDSGTAEPAEVLADAVEVQDEVRRASQIDVSDVVLAMVDTKLDHMRESISQFYGVSLHGREGTSFLRYDVGGFYKRHVDRAHVTSWPMTARRKVTVVLFLESSRDAELSGGFSGGVLRLYPDDLSRPVDVTPTRGTLVAFPAEMPHEITRITAGRRDTIVDWFY
jgi:predicted 2-oxoglutarate/Fe(II)-dependent dioxygenase YbiX